MQHLDDGTINELLDGEIASSELPPIATHLAGCTQCSERLERARELIAESDALVLRLDDEPAAEPVAVPARSIRGAPWTHNLAWAAALIVAVGVGYISGHSPKPDTATIAQTTSTESTPPTPAPIAVDRSNQPTAPVGQQTARPNANSAPPAAARQRKPSVPRKQADSAPKQANASAAVEPTAKTATAEESALDATSSNDGVVDEQRLVARDRLAFDSVEIESNRGVLRTNLAPQHHRIFKSTNVHSSADSLGTPAGTLFRIDGLNLLRSELLPDRVRLIYSHPDGEVQLIQRRVGFRIAWHLVVPEGFPADSLRELLGRVK